MLNKVMLIGRLGADPELRYTQSGSPVATLRVATDESYTDKDGNRVEKTEWHRVVTFQRQAENCANYLGKGSLVYVEGNLQTRKWQDQQGQDRYMTEIRAQRVQFLDRKGENRGGENFDNDYGQPQRAPQRQEQRGRGHGDDNFGKPSGRGRPSLEKNHPPEDNMGDAFPSEGADMDGVPF